jgi:CRP-like cAMP-binding protein
MTSTAEQPARIVFKPGEVIFEQDEAADCAYFVESGEVEVYRFADGRSIVLGKVGKGRLLGEIALIDGGARTASARAVAETVCLRITGDQFEKYLGNLDPLMRLVISTLIRYVRTNTRLLGEASELG